MRNLKINTSDYLGGILCIDEIEMSLHPNAQINLLLLLKKLTKELDLQIFMTTHSLTILKEILKLQKNNYLEYRLLYFKGTRVPNITNISSYTSLKADLFNEMSSIQPSVKVYCEDEISKMLIEALICSAKDNNIQVNLPNYKIIPINLGDQNLQNLPNLDSYFNTVCFILDGDSKIKNNRPKIEDYLKNPDIFSGLTPQNFHENYLSLPGYLSPEEYCYMLIREYTVNDQNHLKFWRNLEKLPGTELFSSDKVLDKYIKENVTFKKIHRKKEYVELLKEIELLTDYFSNSDHKKELENWMKSFENVLVKVNNRQKAKFY